MDSSTVLYVFLAVGIIFGAVRSGHAGCRDRLRNIRDERQRLRTEWHDTRLDLKEKKDNSELTKEYLITTVEGVLESFTDFKTKVERFCQRENCKWDECPTILGRLKDRLGRLQGKLEEYKNTDESVLDGSIKIEEIMPSHAPFDYTTSVVG